MDKFVRGYKVFNEDWTCSPGGNTKQYTCPGKFEEDITPVRCGHGCNDPFWPDGCNLNLTRNHIIADRKRIEMLCEEHELPLPEEYYYKIPPVVDDNYMANLKQEKRVERLVQQGNKLTIKKTKFIDDGQLTFG